MFSEKNIPNLIIITPIISIVILVLILLYSLIKNQENYFIKESLEFEKEYVLKQKQTLKSEINKIFDYINYQKNLLIENTKKSMKIQMNSFLRNIQNKTIVTKDFSNYINQHSNSNSDFIIFDLSKNKLYKNPDVFFFYKKKKQLLKILNTKNEKFQIDDETTIYYFKYLKDLNLIVVLKKDIYYLLDDLKYTIARWVEFLKFENNNFFWIHTNTNILIAHGKRKKDIGKDDTNKLDSKNNLYVQKSVRLAIKNNKGDFLEFYSKKNEKNMPSKKLAFVKLYKEWNWIIGSGIYLDESNEEIQHKKYLLEKKINKYIQTAIVIAFLLIIFISILSILISQQINKTFQNYQIKVKRKEIELQDLNKNLEKRVKKAIKEAKQKDRAMLHQSRLARMGEMLNMISHQWRQPLSQISSIIMEIETRIAFNKSNNKFILSSAEELNEIVLYMSNTIEDFKNFFKPEKNKTKFKISDSCNNAIALVKDSLNNQKIILNYNIKNDKIIEGYPREYSQVILNLLLNARDALVSNQILNAQIYLCIDAKAEKSIVTVKDNAKGIKEENIERIFEPYFSTKKSQGTGLGLYMSKVIIETNMQGKLSVQNSKNGAIFKVIV